MAKRNPSPPTLQFLPMAIDLRGRDCVVVGGGAVGTRKAGTLVQAGARVTVIAPEVTDELRALVRAGAVRWIEGPFHEAQVHGAMLVVAATNYQVLNHTIVEQARRAGALACDASSSAGSQVIFGALLEHDGATIAVFTNGRDPSRARHTRDRIARLVAQDEDQESQT